MPELPPKPPNPSDAALRRAQAHAPPRQPPPLPPPKPGAATPAPDVRPSWWHDEGRIESSAWLVSFVVHAVAVFLLGLITLNAHTGAPSLRLLASSGEGDAPPGQLAADTKPDEPDLTTGSAPKTTVFDAAPLSSPEAPSEKPELLLPRPALSSVKVADVRPRPTGDARPTAKGDKPSAGGTGGTASGTEPVGGFGGRDPASRGKTAGERGGNKKSEAAVERGLNWLAAHQRKDGSWCFNLNEPPCNGMCRNSGDAPSTTASTGLALLPFLGAGYTHLEGEHKDVVKRGLYYLSTKAIVTRGREGISLTDGSTMYGHGIATIALCEAYGMTKDETLKALAQGAVRYIVTAQDPRGGGWRYTPGEQGDTTVTGWQLMALKSAQMAKLEVPSPTLSAVRKFLDGVQYDRGSRYGYQTANMRAPDHENTTAVGLLCRMYTGWRREKPQLYRGIKHLHRWGPSRNNMYYNYYATQVMFHWGGAEWEAWNDPMRDYLISHQSTESHESGSWHFPDPMYGDHGGRLYNTALAIMMLEVYYRHLPLFGEEAVRGR